ncbi:MAG: rhodanese-like domain-containing protein [Thermoplasmatota archaeon]
MATGGTERQVIEGIQQVAPGELPGLLEQGVTVVDIREDFERAAGYIPGTLHRAMSRYADWKDEFPASQELVLQCRSGRRSQDLAKVMQAAGHGAVHNLAGGILAQE